MDESAQPRTEAESPPRTGSPERAVTPPRTNDSSPKEGYLSEERYGESLQWQQALSESLAAVAKCIRAIPPGIDHMDAALANSLEVVAVECRNAIPAKLRNAELSRSQYSRPDIVDKRLTELESKFHLLFAHAKANAHALARAYNRSCLRLTDSLCPLLDKNELVPPEFPDTVGHFQELSKEAVMNLLVTYQVPEIPDSDEERRIDLARYIGVNV